MSEPDIDDRMGSKAESVYEADPVLRLSGVDLPDSPVEPMSARERVYFAKVCDSYLARRTNVHLELVQAWTALRAEFIADSLFGCVRPASTHKTVAEIEALALLLRVTCCRCDQPVWRGYHVDLRMALINFLRIKAYVRALPDWENCVSDILFNLFDRRLDAKAVLPLTDSGVSGRVVELGTPKFWRYNPVYYFVSWLNKVAVHFISDDRGRPGHRPEHNLPLDDGLICVVPADIHVEDEAIDSASANPERERLFERLGRELNSVGLHPSFIEANIRALVAWQQEAEAKARAPGEAEKIRTETLARVFSLQEMNAGWQNHKQILDSTNLRIENELGSEYELKRYDEQKLFWWCADLFMLYCMEACGADVSLLDIYLKRLRPKDRDCPRDAAVRRRMASFLKTL